MTPLYHINIHELYVGHVVCVKIAASLHVQDDCKKFGGVVEKWLTALCYLSTFVRVNSSGGT